LGVRRASPVILLQGAATATDRIPRITLLGVREDFWPPGTIPVDAGFWGSDRDEVVLNEALARDLGIGPGESVVLHVQRPSAVPRESLLGRRDAGEVVDNWKVMMRAVAGTGSLSRFSLTPTPTASRNAFVPLHALQNRLEQKGRVNGVLVAGSDGTLQEHLHQSLTLDDWGLSLRDPPSRTREVFANLDHNHDDRLEYNEWHGRLAGQV